MIWPSLPPLTLSAFAAVVAGVGCLRLLARPNDRTSIIGSFLYNHDLKKYRRHALKAGLKPHAAYREAVRRADAKWNSPA